MICKCGHEKAEHFYAEVPRPLCQLHYNDPCDFCACEDFQEAPEFIVETLRRLREAIQGLHAENTGLRAKLERIKSRERKK
jgi:hypothetical protein